ncbi:MAG: cytochrome P450 [Minicystis sp.]
MTNVPVDTLSASLPEPRVHDRGLPLIGVLPRMLADAPRYLSGLAHRNHGQVVTVQLGPYPLHLVSHPDHVQHVLAGNARNYNKEGGLWQPLRKLFGDGLATADGEVWRHSRRRLQPVFTARHIASLVDLMVEGVARGVRRFDAAARSGAPLDVSAEMTMLAQEILLHTMLGVTVGPAELDALGGAVLAAFQRLNRRLFLYFLPPWMPLPGERALQRAIASIDEAIYGFIRARRATGGDREDLLSLLLSARDSETGAALTDAQIRDELVTLFITGSETIAATMTWAWYAIEQHPEVERRLRDEIDAVLGARAPTFADLARMPYCRMVLQETSRLYPTAWFIPRMAMDDDEIDGCPIRARSIVVCSPYVTQRDPAIWEDPLRFDPDRFHPERAARRHKYAHYPFGGGARQCIGQHFAMTEVQLVLIMLCQQYRLRRVEGPALAPKAIPSLWPSRALRMTVTPA